MDLAIEARNLIKKYGPHTALDGLCLEVPRGSFFGLLGPNGAGKTTAVSIITGLLRPDGGDVRVLGFNIPEQDLEVKRRIGFVAEVPFLFDGLTGWEYLEFCGRVYGLTQAARQERIARVLQTFELDADQHRLVRHYSKGMRKRLSVAAALLHGPELLILDEPFEGVDPVGARVIKDILRIFVSHGGTVLLTSHVLDVVERLCSHVAIIHEGRMLWQGPLEAFLEGSYRLEDRLLQLLNRATEVSELNWL